MLERMQLFPLSFYKKGTFNGSMGQMHFRLGKKEIENAEGEKKTILQGTTWRGPFCFDVTKEEKTVKEFSYAEEGICEALNWFNEESKRYNQ